MINVVGNGWTGRDPKTHVLQENHALCAQPHSFSFSFWLEHVQRQGARLPWRWPQGIKALGDYLHARTPKLQLGCYTSPWTKNCCGEPGSLGFEAVDMEYFAQVGCDHGPNQLSLRVQGVALTALLAVVMVDWCRPYIDPKQARDAYAVFGSAIANSSNPNMLFGIWSAGIGKSWKWGAEVGGHYWRTATDM